MFRKTALGLAAAAVVAIAMTSTASNASAGVKVQFHFGAPIAAPVYGYSHGYRAPYGYRAPVVRYRSCPRVFVGYQKVHTTWGWQTRPMYRRHCGY